MMVNNSDVSFQIVNLAKDRLVVNSLSITNRNYLRPSISSNKNIPFIVLAFHKLVETNDNQDPVRKFLVKS